MILPVRSHSGRDKSSARGLCSAVRCRHWASIWVSRWVNDSLPRRTNSKWHHLFLLVWTSSMGQVYCRHFLTCSPKSPCGVEQLRKTSWECLLSDLPKVAQPTGPKSVNLEPGGVLTLWSSDWVETRSFRPCPLQTSSSSFLLQKDPSRS